MSLRFLLLVLALNFVGPSLAFAQDDSARAIELIAQANAAYDSGDFRNALRGYREAYAITEDPRVLYRIGVTYENLANYQRAREHLELYLYAEPNSKYADRVQSKIENLRNLEANLQSAVRVESQPVGASVWVDIESGPPAGVTPVRLPLGPGAHTVLIRKDGFEDVRDTVEVGAGETLEKSYDLGAGGAVATTKPVEPTPEVTTPPPPAEDLTLNAGTPTRLRIGPSMGVTVMSWAAIGIGWAIVIGSGALATGFAPDGALVGTGFFAGAGLIGLGAYFLWFRDYTRDLPPAPVQGSAPGQRAMGIGLRF